MKHSTRKTAADELVSNGEDGMRRMTEGLRQIVTVNKPNGQHPIKKHRKQKK